VRLLIDAQLPPALARAFNDAGFPAQHVRAFGLVRASDEEVWAFARGQGFAVVTKDEDFAARWPAMIAPWPWSESASATAQRPR
jgi:predicted nuclease of predicted toxin-antitoxin system